MFWFKLSAIDDILDQVDEVILSLFVPLKCYSGVLLLIDSWNNKTGNMKHWIYVLMKYACLYETYPCKGHQLVKDETAHV